MSADAEYLVATVGPVLSQGVAECLIADPEDYVAFVGQWLKQYVKNTSVTEQVRQEKANDEANLQRTLAAAAAAKSALQAQISHKQAVLAEVRIASTGERLSEFYSVFYISLPESCWCSMMRFASESNHLVRRSPAFLGMHWMFGNTPRNPLWRTPKLHLHMSWW